MQRHLKQSKYTHFILKDINITEFHSALYIAFAQVLKTLERLCFIAERELKNLLFGRTQTTNKF